MIKRIVKRKNNINFWLNKQWSCINCGIFIFNEVPFCNHCFSLLDGKIDGNQIRKISNIDINFLINWVPKESDSTSNLLIYLKNQEFSVWAFWASYFYEKNAKTLDIKNSSIFIPCPSRNPKRQHSLNWAVALAQMYDGTVLDCFEYITKDAGKSQRQKNIKGRESVSQMKFKKEFNYLLENKHLIFVDDIVTSGSTIRAALSALEPGTFSHVICLANRGQLAPS